MLKKILLLPILLLAILLTVMNNTSFGVFAQDEGITKEEAEQIIPLEEVSVEDEKEAIMEEEKEEEINSFEMFWPMVAGKTKGDRFYSLKRLKEKIRGILIFSKAKKADYEIFLATKRVLEAEKLLNDGNSEDAQETLEEALDELDEASEHVDDVSEKGQTLGESVHQMNNRLDNIAKLTTHLSKTYDEKKLFEVAKEASELSDKV